MFLYLLFKLIVKVEHLLLKGMTALGQRLTLGLDALILFYNFGHKLLVLGRQLKDEFVLLKGVRCHRFELFKFLRGALFGLRVDALLKFLHGVH